MKKKFTSSSVVLFIKLFLKKMFKVLILLFMCALLCACIGVSMDITVRADGSGTIALEYRVSHFAEALGKLDGNERWQTVPVGRADFERSMSRTPGLRLASFSSSDNGTDVITRAEISYKNFQDILDFLDPSQSPRSNRVFYENINGKNRLFIILADNSTEPDPDLLALAGEIFSGYTLKFSLSVPGTAVAALTDSNGTKIPPPESIRIVPQGKKVSVTMDMLELFVSGNRGLEFTW